MQRYFTIKQLAKASGLKEATVRKHARRNTEGQCRLRAEQFSGVKGLRVEERSARFWLNKHFPERRNALDDGTIDGAQSKPPES